MLPIFAAVVRSKLLEACSWGATGANSSPDSAARRLGRSRHAHSRATACGVWKTFVSAFTQALADLGWTDGRNVRMDLRWGASNVDHMRMSAKELLDLRAWGLQRSLRVGSCNGKYIMTSRTLKVTRFALAAGALMACLFIGDNLSSIRQSSLITQADARVGNPLTPRSVAGVARRQTRRAVRPGAIVTGAAVGTGAYYRGYYGTSPYYGTGYYGGTDYYGGTSPYYNTGIPQPPPVIIQPPPSPPKVVRNPYVK